MSGPAFAKLGVTKSNPAYFAQMAQMYFYMKTTRSLFSVSSGLWYRDNEARIKTGANTPEFCGRGNGWVIAACARVLEELPAGDSRRPEFIGMLQTMAAALLPLQGVDGFWHSNLKFPMPIRTRKRAAPRFSPTPSIMASMLACWMPPSTGPSSLRRGMA